MLGRSLICALLLLAVLAPGAGAATLGDGYVPDAETLPGVTVTVGKQGERSLRFGAKAAAVYRTLAGKRATYSCARSAMRSGTCRARYRRTTSASACA